ncbi:ABC-2 type transport system permease protein [Lishizhenia tianjinensis]|uniref:ABC-2 type transport system permease protein n=1 Tax=Lishizhenia tianjinensis TaxID=477690 RepID=A0A1I7B2U0_9FLAO|nr:ABC transporter permease [Lishizhenia tianjinensis]SFT81507.1 ABC-2 type transport system permease protein [Lishizhenia tianjinensis]
MKHSWLIAMRELKERVKSRSFLLMALLGPILVLGLTYLLFALGGSEKKILNVLIMDPQEIMSGKIMPKEDPNIKYSFTNTYVDFEEFAKYEEYQKFDIGVELNEKVISNKHIKVMYRETPSERVKTRIQYHVERRFEEIFVKEFTQLSVQKFREIKQPMQFHFFNVYDPKNTDSKLSAWAGYFFGLIIILFIFLFGMTILRSVSKEKSNRIVEVILASVSARQLLVGKVIGIGISALFQFVLWSIIIGTGLFILRETVFIDLLDPSNFNPQQMTQEIANASMQEKLFAAREYNDFVELVYERIQFSSMLIFFTLFFIVAYIFYGSFFAAVGASMGSESDGQQYIIPIMSLLLLALYGGYYTVYYPEGPWANVFAFLPFTSPVAMMVKLGIGFSANDSWELFASLGILLGSALLMFYLAGKIYQNGILQFGHRLKAKHFIKWLKKS